MIIRATVHNFLLANTQVLQLHNSGIFAILILAVTSTNPNEYLGDIPSGRLAYPTLQGAAAEAAFMTGMERNSDVVFASAC